MASMRRIMKHVLLDRDVQRIVGVSISGISKEAMKNTFSWNPNEAEEARRALIDGTDEKFEDDEREDDFTDRLFATGAEEKDELTLTGRQARMSSRKSHSEEALPEKILGTVEWNHFDLDPDNSPVIKVCGEDN